jgi:hypothetical protein
MQQEMPKHCGGNKQPTSWGKLAFHACTWRSTDKQLMLLQATTPRSS